MFEKISRTLGLITVLFTFSLQSFASSIVLLENTSFTRAKGKPKTETVQFSYQAAAQFELTVFNGGANNQYCRISSAIIKLNNQTVFSQSDFNQQVYRLSTNVSVQSKNTLSVKLNSKPGCGIEINVGGDALYEPLVITSSAPSEAIVGQAYHYQLSTSPELDWSHLAVELLSAPNGMLISNGLVEWTPLVEQVGEQSISLIVGHAEHGQAEQIFTINTVSINQAPKAENIVIELVEDNVAYFSLLASDPQSDPLSYSILSQPQHGLLQLSDEQVIYTPTDNFYGTDSFEYQANDGSLNSNSATVLINVSAVNDKPQIVSEPLLSVAENTAYSYSIEAIDVDDDVLNYQLIDGPSGMNLSAAGVVSWLPLATQIGQHTVSISVIDGQGLSDSQSFLLIVKDINEQPQVTSSAMTTSNENEVYAYHVIANDPDVNDRLIFTLTVAPVGMQIIPETGSINWHPTASQIGNHSITVTVTDSAGLTDTQSFILTILNVVDAPIIISSPVITATEGLIYSYQVEAIDQDQNDTLNFSFTAKPSGMTIDSDSGLIQWTPDSDQTGEHNISVMVTDSTGLIDTQSFNLSVINVNDLPQIISNPITSGQELVDYSYQLIATDLDNDPIKFLLVTFPVGMSISDTDLISWTPSVGQSGSHLVVVSADDSQGGLVTQEFNIQVEPRPNSAPVAVDNNVNGLEDTAVNLSLTATDVDNNSLSYQIITQPVNGVLSGNAPEIVYTPNNNFFGSDIFTFKANDGVVDSNIATVTMTINSVNDAPTISSTPITTVNEKQAYFYDVTAADFDSVTLSFNLSVAPSGMTIDAQTGVINWTPTAAQIGSQSVKVVVTDDAGLTDSQNFVIVVNNVNEAPSITSTAVTSVDEKTAYVYDVNATDPDTGDSLTYSLNVAPSGMTVGASNGVINWTPTAEQIGNQSVTVVVTDAAGLIDSQSFVVVVNNVNEAPSITSTAVTSINEKTAYVYDVNATDPDAGDNLTYSLTIAPTGMTIVASEGIINWTPTTEQIGVQSVTVVVTDTDGLTDSQSFVIDVIKFNEAPIITSLPVISVNENENYVYDVNAIDPDGSLINYALMTGPAGMTINSETGLIDWQPDNSIVNGNLEPNLYCRVPATEQLQLPKAIDAVVVTDGSGSNFKSWPWVSGAMAELNAALKLAGIGSSPEENRYGLVGFMAGPESTNFENGLFGTISELYEATYNGESPGGVGGNENALRALQYTIDSYPFRDDVAKNIIWVPDEPQQGVLQNSETLVDFTQRLIDGQYNINLITNLVLRCEDGREALGFDSQQRGYVYDNNGGFEYCAIAIAHLKDASGQYVTNYGKNYIEPTLATDGAVWSLFALFNHPDSLNKALTTRMYNTITVNQNQQDLTDLTVSNIALNEIENGNVELIVNVTNRGLATFNSSSVINILNGSATGQVLDSQTFSNLLVGEQRSVSFILSKDSLADQITVIVNTGESEECIIDNNQLTVPVVNLQAADGNGATAKQIFTITVQDLNQPPQISSQPDLQAFVGQLYQYQILIDDPDLGDAHQYRLDGNTKAELNINSGLLTYQPTLNDLGEQIINVMVTDLAGEEARQTFTLNITGDYQIPKFVDPSKSRRAVVNELYQFTPEVSADPTSILTFSLIENPTDMQIDPSDGTINWAATDEDLNRLRLVSLAVVDQFGNRDVLSFMLFGDHINQAPEIISTPQDRAILNKPYTYKFDYDDENIREEFEVTFNTSAQGITSNIPVRYPYSDNLAGSYADINWEANQVSALYPRHLKDNDFMCQATDSNIPSSALPFTQMWSSGPRRNHTFGKNVLAVPLFDTNNDGVINNQDRSALLVHSTYGLNYYLKAKNDLTGEDYWEYLFVGDNRPAREIAPAIADLNKDGIPDIILVEARSQLLMAISSDDRRLLWKSTQPISSDINSRGQIVLTDIEGDGSAEILAGFSIYDQNGNLLQTYQEPVNRNSDYLTSPIYAIDMDDDGQLELIQQGVVRKADGTELWRPAFSDGHTSKLAYSAFANFDNDPQLEMVLVERSDNTAAVATISLLDNDGRFIWEPKIIDYIGQPVVGDMDGDGELEIFVSGEDVLLDHNGIEQWHLNFPRKDGSVAIAADLQGNGRLEIILNRYLSTYAIDGLSGSELLKTGYSWANTRALPIVLDLNGDNNPEIVNVSQRAYLYSYTGLYEHKSFPHYANQNWWQINGLTNNLQVNGAASQSQQNAQTDQVLVASSRLFDAGVPDLWVDAPRGDHRQLVQVLVKNRGTADHVGQIEVKLFAGDPLNGGLLLASRLLPDLLMGEEQLVEFEGEVPSEFVGELVATIKATAEIQECQSNNNMTSAHIMDLSVSDHEGATVSQNYLLGVEYSSSPPSTVYVPQGSDLDIVEGELFELTIGRWQSASVDDNNTAAYFSLTTAPQTMTIDPVSGTIRWRPGYGEAGNHAVTVKSQHLVGDSSRTLVVRVLPGPNRAPVITSSAPTQSNVNELFAYNVTAEDPDGDVLSFSLTQAPDSMSINGTTGLIQWTAPVIGEHEVIVSVSDGEAETLHQFSLYIVAPNQSLAITSEPVKQAVFDQVYRYQVEASDGNGNALTYALMSSITGMAINAISGEIIWTPTIDQLGSNEVSIRVTNGVGGIAIQTYLVNVSDGTNNGGLPVIESVPAFNAKIDLIYNYQIVVSGAANSNLSFSLVEAPQGMTISADGLISWTPSEIETVSVNVNVANATGSVSHGWNIQVLPADAELSIDFYINPKFANEGDKVTIQAWPTNAIGSVDMVVTVDGEPLELNSNYVAEVVATGTGAHQINATVADQYSSLSKSDSFYVSDAADTTAPSVSISQPDVSNKVTAPTEIIATINDENLANWRLIYKEKGSAFNEFVVMAEGTNNVTEQALATFDPTMLQNGLYWIILDATDINGQTTQDDVVISVEGDLKVGNFSITFEDVNIPVTGMPIVVTRTYDSRQRHQNLDFGKGWSVDYQNVRIQESRVLSKGWNVNVYPQGFFNNYCVEPNGDPIVTITLPDGRVERFKVKVDPHCQLIQPAIDVTLQFEAIEGTTSTLTQQSYSQLRLVNDELVNLSAPDEEVDPSLYQLTTADGYIFDLDQGFSIRKITTPDGHFITFTEQGVMHSGGKGIEFERDSKNRITSILLPDGNRIRYEYDAGGNLVKQYDELNQATEFTYSGQHLLEDIIDANGVRVTRNEYDDSGRLVAQIDADGNRIEFTHDIDARREVIKDRRGNTKVFTYDESGNVLTETNALAETITRTYDAMQNVLSETDALGNMTEWTYDNKRNKLSETNPLGHITTYSYSTLNKVLTETDVDGNVVLTNTYEVLSGRDTGKILESVNSLGEKTTFGYNEFSGQLDNISDELGSVAKMTYAGDYPNSTTDANGIVTTRVNDAMGRKLSETSTRALSDGTIETLTTAYVYDEKGRLTQVTDAQGNVTKTEFNIFDKETASIDAAGRRTEYEYDIRGNLISTTYPDGSVETNEYDAENNLVKTTDRNGAVTTQEYDAANRLVKTTFADGSSSSSEYDAAGRITASIDALGNRTEFVYDAVGQQTQVTDALGNVTSYVYDKHGNRIQMIDANNQVYVYEYDLEDRLVKTIYPNASSTSTISDVRGRKLSDTDQANTTTSYEYDGAGRLLKVIDVLNQQTTYSYDEQGNKLTQTDAEGRTTSWTYDSLGRQLTRTLPLGQVESFSYDVLGNLLTHTDFNGDLITYVYDINNSVTSIAYSQDDSVDSFTYDNNGNRLTSTKTDSDDNQKTWTYTYDVMNRLASETKPSGEKLEYAYDANGNKTQLKVTYVDTSIRIENSTYDALNRLATVTDADGNVTTYEYDAVGNRSSVTHSNANVTSYVYDELNRLTQMQDKQADETVYQQFDYELHATGRRTKITELSGRVSDYTYDELYRLTAETITDSTNGNYAAEYQFDKVGNRTSATINGVSKAYTYDDNDRLTQEGNKVYTYDEQGNTLSKSLDGDVTNYTYDAKQKLVGASILESGATKTSSYEYNVDGIRTQKVEEGVATNFLVDNNQTYAQVIAETDNSDAVTASYTYGDDLLSMMKSGQIWSYQYDGLGSTRALTDSTGEISDTYAYDAFGNLLSETGDTENSYRYTGEQYDEGLDNYYLRARYYDSSVGRFSQQDEWMGRDGEPATLNKYLYTHADPVNGVDPSGHMMTMGETGATQTIQGILKGGTSGNFRVFIRESAEGVACFMIQELVEKEVGKVLSGLYIFEDAEDLDRNGNNRGRPYVGRSEDLNRRKAEHGKRVKNYIARIEFSIDNIFDKFGLKGKNVFTNHLKLIEQWIIEEIDFNKTSNKRNEVAKNPGKNSKNSRPIRNQLMKKLKVC